MRYLAFACLLLLAVVLASQTAHAGLDVSFSFRPLQFRPAITELGGGAELQFNQRAFTPTFRSVNVQTGVGVATPQLQQRSWTTGIGGIGASWSIPRLTPCSPFGTVSASFSASINRELVRGGAAASRQPTGSGFVSFKSGNAFLRVRQDSGRVLTSPNIRDP